MEDLLDVAPHIHLFNEVHTEYYWRTAMSCECDLQCEPLYYLLFDDIRRHSEIYFNVLFQMNDIYVERCAGMLYTLASILRHRGKLQECLKVLHINRGVIRRYQEISNVTTVSTTATKGQQQPVTPRRRRRRKMSRSQQRCCRLLTYKFNNLCIDTNAQMGHRQAAVSALRDACQYEAEEGLDFEHQRWLDVLFHVAGPAYKDLSTKDIAAMDDEKLWQALLLKTCTLSSSVDEGGTGPTFDVTLNRCHGCNRIEETRGEFEECSRCLKVNYCSYDCQDRHWKVHKKHCSKSGSSKRTLLPSFSWLN